MVISIRNTAGVRCMEVVRFSEGPLWEVRLYSVAVHRPNSFLPASSLPCENLLTRDFSVFIFHHQFLLQ